MFEGTLLQTNEVRGRRVSSRRAGVLIGIAGLVNVGCDAKISEFTPSAHYVCAGQRVTLAWQVTGDATVKVTPPQVSLPDGKVDSQGTGFIEPTQTTTVELHATRCLGNPTSSIQTIRVIPPDPVPKNLVVSIGDAAASPTCTDGRVSATIHPKNFDPGLTVAMVSEHNGDARTYQVTHAGVSGTVGPGAASPAFSGKPVLGDWTLTSPLTGQESCGTDSSPAVLPHNLMLDVFIECRPGAAP